MENAWLDSLSEDWISQPRSEGSQADTPLESNATSLKSQMRPVNPSRIPLLTSRRQPTPTCGDNGQLPLNERSSNDNNIPGSHRASIRPPKQRQENSGETQSLRGLRTASGSTIGSIRHHTVHHNSLSVSPKKSTHGQYTPEWKRRLLHGEVAYGEQRDLFSPAGLENIFRPPPQIPLSFKAPERLHSDDTTMPSSPPPYGISVGSHRISASSANTREEDQSAAPKNLGRLKYKMLDMVSQQFSDDSLSRSSSFHPIFPSQDRDTRENQQISMPHGFPEQLENSSESSIRQEANRIASGKSDVRHEDLSPIYISRHNTVDGRIDYSALDLPAAELQQRLEHLTVSDNLRHSRSSQSSEVCPQLLRRNETIGSEGLTHIGKFVSLGRGGDSEDGSFQQRMLSPSSLPPVDESGMLCEASVEASTPKSLRPFTKAPQLNNSATRPFDSVSPRVPRVPNPSPIKDENSNSRPGSGSPLKLFGTYDTFTNQKLLRRLSQFENSMSHDCAGAKLGSSNVGEPGTESISQTEMNEAFIAPSSPSKRNQNYLRNINRFGDGDLDKFEFSEGSLESNRGMLEALEESILPSPQDAQSHVGFNFHLEPLPTLDTGRTGQWRTKHINTTIKERIVTTKRSIRLEHDHLGAPLSRSVADQLEVLDTPRKRNGDIEGKRLLHSPPKNPTPKRRRTLHETDISHAALDGQKTDIVKGSQGPPQSVVGKKRKDARHGDNQEAADPQILATRQILRPRTTTPGQRNNQGHKHGGIPNAYGSDSERARLEQKEKIARVQAELDATASSWTSTAAGTGKPMNDDSRKGSVTTQDFLDEAKKIMAGIRGKARPSSGLASVEESESEHDKGFSVSQGTGQNDSFEESTKEPFSRPPSRDGGPLPRLPQRQQDPNVLDHLKKYEEMSDMDGVTASSLKSTSQPKDVIKAASNVDCLPDETINEPLTEDLELDQAYQSEPPNIRITEYPELQRKRKHSTSSAPTGTASNHDPEFPSHGSNESSVPSSGRSVPTGSSRGSDSKHIIAPHTVSHLIPEQLAGMIFDRKKLIWVKQKVVSGEQEYNEILASEDTDDDPFGDIPDLTVDEVQELNRIKAVAAQKGGNTLISEVLRNQNQLQGASQPISTLLEPTMQTLAARNASSTDFTKPSNFSRAPATATQATQLTSMNDASDVPGLPTSITDQDRNSEAHGTTPELVEDVEQEISIHQSRVEHTKHIPRQRNVTISFSSPLASIIPPEEYFDRISSDKDKISDDESILLHKSTLRRSYSARTRSFERPGSRKQSLTNRNFISRPVSRIDEQDEESFARHTEDDGLQRSVSILISTPLAVRANAAYGSTVPGSSVTHYTGGILQLTPLSDFSMNQPDESFALEASYVGQRRHQPASGVGKRSLSLSVKELVQRITDVEPYEPFWEHIKNLELRGKKLQTLHMLSKFCSKLEELDVSDNNIGQLDGIPGTVRTLRIARNCLSDLSSWVHLSNLQYVDISNNCLTSLEGLKNLIHLRSLRADNNKIQCLKGVHGLDGLISLRLRGNLVQNVDFAGSSLQRLTDLDLKGNCVREIRNLQELRSLTNLNLEDNDIERFARENCELLSALKYLKLGGNNLEHLDITQYPNLRLLYLDRNRLGRITGLLKAQHLDSLSLREQQEGFSIDQNFLNEALEVRKLFLSRNLLTTFQASVTFLNLQYLELANCGLEELPIEFGRMTPNLRVLNLNFNAIHDIKPLLGIVRLKKLQLAGNRLARLRKTTYVLAQFPTLTRVDLRNNPLTLGFYPPPSEKRMITHDGQDEERDTIPTNPFTLPDGDRESDAAYARRLDMETGMRRRVFEMLALGGCRRLKMLDGLPADRAGVVIRDNVWEALVKAGIVYERADRALERAMEPHTNPAVTDGGEQCQEASKNEDLQGEGEGESGGDCNSDSAGEERWQAEDSFA